jgi:hypothetical protein
MPPILAPFGNDFSSGLEKKKKIPFFFPNLEFDGGCLEYL